MVSPRKLANPKKQNEVSKSKTLDKYVFYLDIKNTAASKEIEEKIKKFGGHVEVFLVDGVTHIVSDSPCGPGVSSPRTPQTPNSTATPHPWVRGRRADAMLERAANLHHNSPRVPPQHNLPVWSLVKIKQFLSRIGSLAYRKVLKEPFIKFEAADRKSRTVYKELNEWPELQLGGEHSGCPFASPVKWTYKKLNSAKQTNKTTKQLNKPKVNKALSTSSKKRMTKKSKGRVKEQAELNRKQSGYCEICRVDYSHLPDHERSPSHTAFVKNCSNFLSLDSLISAEADVEAFLKMNTSITTNHSIERRSLRNIVKLHQEESADPKKQLEIICNGGSPRRQPTPQMSPALSDSKHYLRSKGSEKKDYRNGSLSPQVHYEKTDVSRLNGKVEELERCSPVHKGKKAKFINKWRKHSPEISQSTGDTHSYYKVIGMSTKLRSSASFAPAPPPPNSTCNGNGTNSGLVVKFKRVRKSELSVLSDEAENFMFPKKDDSDTEDERESSQSSSKEPSTDIKTESFYPVKEEEDSQDSCGSDITRKNPRRRTHVDSYRDSIDYYGLEYTPPPRAKRRPSTASGDEKEIPKESSPTQLQKSLKWVNGHLRASEQVEKLTYSFEQVPKSEPWFNSFVRQDQGKKTTKSALPYLNFFNKPPVLPYEMAELPPLKPNCCILSQMKKLEPKPARSYGTRGMKKKRICKVDPVFVGGLNPRKSPREHASTLAILGGLIHRKRSKLSGSEDSKSLPSIAEEETSSDTPSIPLLNPIYEASRQLHQLLSTVFQDDSDEIPVDSMEGVNIERGKTNNVLELIDNFDKSELFDDTLKEICDNTQPERAKSRKGHKFKKKNKTGWPNKKKVSKKDVGSRCSSHERSTGLQGNNLNRLDENSITSISELEENASVSDKVMDNADDNAVSVSDWQGTVDLQPVVRVLKMEESTARRLRSAASVNCGSAKDKKRKLRRRKKPHR